MANKSSSRWNKLGGPRGTLLVQRTNNDCPEVSYKSVGRRSIYEAQTQMSGEGVVVNVSDKH